MTHLLTLLCALSLLWSSPAAGQWATMDEQPWQMDINRPALERLIDVIELDPLQTEVVEAIYADFVAVFQHWTAECRKRDRELRAAYENKRHGSLAYHQGNLEHQKFGSECAATQEAMNARLLVDIGSLLREDQREAWRSWQRWNTRRRLLHAGAFTEEKIDICGILEQLEITPENTNDPELFSHILAEYERSLDRALQERLAWKVEQIRYKWKRIEAATLVDGENVWVRGASGGPEEWERYRTKRKQLHTTIRDLNRRTVRQLIALLSADQALATREAYAASRITPYASRRDQAFLYIRALRKDESMNQEQHILFDAVEQSHAVALARIEAALVDAHDEEVEAGLRSDYEDQQLAQDHIQHLLQERADEINNACRKAFQILPPDSQTAYPLPEPVGS
ncbi:MAG: hypothetical protein ACR2GY_04045 [Phycisphaerales bacterium]